MPDYKTDLDTLKQARPLRSPMKFFCINQDNHDERKIANRLQSKGELIHVRSRNLKTVSQSFNYKLYRTP